jgi:hypothetical protein
VKTQQAEKKLSRFCGDLLTVEISSGSVIACIIFLLLVGWD